MWGEGAVFGVALEEALAQVSCMKDRTRLYSLFPAEFSQVARWDKNLPYSSLRLDQQ